MFISARKMWCAFKKIVWKVVSVKIQDDPFFCKKNCNNLYLATGKAENVSCLRIKK